MRVCFCITKDIDMIHDASTPLLSQPPTVGYMIAYVLAFIILAGILLLAAKPVEIAKWLVQWLVTFERDLDQWLQDNEAKAETDQPILRRPSDENPEH